MPVDGLDERTLHLVGCTYMLCDVASPHLVPGDLYALTICQRRSTHTNPYSASYSIQVCQCFLILSTCILVADHQPSTNVHNSKTSVTASTMRGALFLSTLCASALAAPLTQTIKSRDYSISTWQPASGSKSSCDKTSDKIIGFYVGPQMGDVLTNACAAMMPACAYPDRLPKDAVCAQVVDWRLDGSKSSTQSANVETAEGNKISGWDLKRKHCTNIVPRRRC